MDSEGTALLDIPDVESLDEEDRARVLTTFLGQPCYAGATWRYVQGSSDGLAPAYMYDEESGMVYILD
jgi:hypothetical protein